MSVYTIVVRHGERIDEVDSDAWQKLMTETTQNDPPLTQTGYKQALKAGAALRKILDTWRHSGGVQGPVAVYSSPTVRTLATAAALASKLGCSEVVPVYALNCCAAAKSFGVRAAFPDEAPTSETMGKTGLACWPPTGDVKEADDMMRSRDGFVRAVKQIATTHTPGDVVVLVSHREGIWELQQSLGCRPASKYCSQHFFSYNPQNNSLSTWDPTREAAPAAKEPAKAASVPVSVAEVLQLGSGTVVIHRQGTGGTCSSATLLWRTPGVRGVWAEGGAVPDGESVDVLSTPQPSENGEGEFVLVRRSSGHEGWAKLKNIRLP